MTDMTQQLQGKALEIITQIQHGVETGAQFAKEQLPDIAQQWISYTIVIDIVSIIFWSILFILVVLGCIFKASKWIHEDNLILVPFGVVTIVSVVGLIVTLVKTLPELILALMAPKVFLLQTLVHIIK
ncbi:MAG: hypothetical protein KGI11_09080 [Thaumarchaeota archaeon]|nr:hypothetical protein [Nitrososphaerota archaeon]